jgi:hypothetical protein
MAGYTPEEIQAFRLKMAGNSVAPLGKGLTEFDKKASDVSASLSRVADKVPFLPSVGASSPATPMVRDAAEQLDLNRKGGIGDLSKATQNALAKPQAPEQLQALNSPTPDVQAAPSLKEQLLSKLRGGGGGGSGTGGLYASMMSARKKQIGDFDTDKELAIEQGENKAQHAMTMAEWLQHDADIKQRHAEIDMKAQEDAHEKTQALIGRNMELADDIGRQKIDPTRLAKSKGTGERISHVLGSALGGFLRGFQGGENKTLERFDHAVSQDIQAQLNEIDNKKAQLGARQNLVAQMIQETGDRRLGVLAARNLYYEAAKQKLAATDAQLGVPEITTAAKQTANVFQHQQDGMNAQIAAEAYQQQQRAAAAAAAAQKAAEKAAWDRQMQLAELGLKRDQLTIEGIKAGKDAHKEDNAAIAETTKRLADDDIVKNRELINSLGRKIDPKTGDVVGLGTGAAIRQKLAGAAMGPLSLVAPDLSKKVALSDEERLAQQEFEQAALLFQTKVTGTGGSDSQMQKIGSAFRGANTMAEKRHAIQLLQTELARREGLAQSNLTDSQKVELNRRLGRDGLVDMPGAVKVKDGNVSDERAKRFKQKLTGGGSY